MHSVDIAEAAPTLLQIGLEEKRDVAVPPVSLGGCVVQLPYPAITLVAPIVAGAPAELAPELLVAGDRPRVEEPERRFEIAVADLERPVEGLDAVVERDALFPDRIPDPLRELVDVARSRCTSTTSRSLPGASSARP